MSAISRADVVRLAGLPPETPLKAGETQLAEAIREHRASIGTPIARFRTEVDGRTFGSFLEAFDDPSASFRTARLTVREPPPDGPAWDFLRPLSAMDFAPDGSAMIHPLDGPPERAIARWRIDERYDFGVAGRVPARGAGPFPLLALAAWLREEGVVPLGLLLDVYFPVERIRYRLDLVGDAVLRDRRAGLLPVSKFVRRSARYAWELDRRLAASGLSPTAARALEVLVELEGASETELTLLFRGDTPNALRELVGRHLAVQDITTGAYRVAPEDLLGPDGPLPPASFAPVPSAPLRSDLHGLLDAAAARATCPLCGDEFPPGYRGILCERCQREVDGTTTAE